MPTGTPVILRDLGGGINEGRAKTELNDNEASYIRNFIPRDRKLIQRKGYADALTTGGGSGYPDVVTGILPKRDINGTWKVYLLGGTNFSVIGECAPPALVVATFSDLDSSPIGLGNWPWSVLQYHDVAYAARRDAGGMRRWVSSAGYSQAGIPAPTTNASIADNGAGSIAAGNTYAFYTFYNTLTGAESGPSPVSAVLNLANNRQIAWTSIDLSTDPQVDARRLYRTTPGADVDSPALFVGQINDNTTTVFADNVAVASMGDAMKKTENGEPSLDIEAMTMHFERMWATDGRDVMFSEFGLPESYDPTNVLTFNPQDGHEVRGLLSFNNLLLVGKTNKTYGVSGITPEEFQIGVISHEHGCFSHNSMKVVDGSAIWWTGRTFVRYAGGAVVDIASEKLRDTLATIPEAYKQYVIAAVDPSRDLYIVSFPQSVVTGSGDDAYRGLVLTYNYKTDAWSPLDFYHGADTVYGNIPSAFADGVGANFERILYASFWDSGLFYFFNGNVDASGSTAITCTWRSKYFAPFGPGILHAIRKAFLLLYNQNAAGSIRTSIYRDRDAAYIVSRVISLAQTAAGLARGWFRSDVSNKNKMGASVALEIVYTGSDPPIEIEGVALEVMGRKQRVISSTVIP